jgi:hypothetical protein
MAFLLIIGLNNPYLWWKFQRVCSCHIEDTGVTMWKNEILSFLLMSVYIVIKKNTTCLQYTTHHQLCIFFFFTFHLLLLSPERVLYRLCLAWFLRVRVRVLLFWFNTNFWCSDKCLIFWELSTLWKWNGNMFKSILWSIWW